MQEDDGPRGQIQLGSGKDAGFTACADDNPEMEGITIKED